MARGKTALVALAAAASVGCSSSSSGEPAAPAPVIDLSGGGSASTQGGGPGGTLSIRTVSPGGVAVRRGGAADTAFAVPAWGGTSVDLGTHGVTVTADKVVVRLAAGAADPGAGVLYVIAASSGLFEADGLGTIPGAGEQVTGLKVNAGTKLTLAANLDTNAETHPDAVRLQLSGDLDVAGTLALPRWEPAESGGDFPRNTSSLQLTASQVFVRSSGRIDSRGGDGTAGDPGGDGGYQRYQVTSLFVNEGTLDLGGGNGDAAGAGGAAGARTGLSVATMPFSPPTATGGGVILNAGSILLVGGDGASGGEGAGAHLAAASYAVNTGRIVAQGGAGRTGAGGASASAAVQLHSTFAAVVNAGTIVAAGGDGLRGGGAGGAVALYSGESAAGDVISSGSITVSGGDDLDDPLGATTTDAAGGIGGSVLFLARGSVRSSGPIAADGGVGHGTSGGGFGGHVTIPIQIGSDRGTTHPLRLGGVQLSGNLSARGGACPRGAGGPGGSLLIDQTSIALTPAAGDPGVELLGYARIALDGGEGSAGGGPVLSTFQITVTGGAPFVPLGSIVNEADVSARSGSGTGPTGVAGWAGVTPPAALTWSTQLSGSATGGDIVNSGSLDLGGGTTHGTAAGGNASGLAWSAVGSITNGGRILCRGGDAQEGRGGMGAASGIVFLADRDVVNTGAIDATPGAGASGGTPQPFGSTSLVRLLAGHQVRNSGAITIPGGRATDAAAGIAGSGGLVELFGQGAPTQNTATCNVAAGTGGHTAGQNGQIWIDAIDRTPASGVL